MNKFFNRLLFFGLFLMLFGKSLTAQTVTVDYLYPDLGGNSDHRFLRFGNSSQYWAGFMWNNTHAAYGDGDDFSIFTYNSRDLTLRAGAGNIIFHPTGTGDVGIGLTAPAAKLHVKQGSSGSQPHSFSDLIVEDNDDAMITLNTPNNKKGYFGFSDSDDTYVGGMQYDHSQDQMHFRVNNQGTLESSIVVDKNGNVGIKTNSPDEKLTVNGTAKAEEIIVEENVGADFVFADDYDLPSLLEVEKYVKSKKHLPEIPSAREMIANGVKVGELQMKLLQKIEELTLYVIEQEKGNKKKDEVIKKLEKRIEHLESKNYK